ncbi:MAG TPA: carboxyl transferase domain-containing protein, partial [Candidatus Binataceae bacterium]|nr:carboxyl transferase domain-containing protein [Candidatus Binataceae bacterium]
ATTVLTDLRRQSLVRSEVSQGELDALANETRRQFTEQSDPYYATSRLWDDGIIEPEDTRNVIGLCLALAAASTPRHTGFTPVFRM